MKKNKTIYEKSVKGRLGIHLPKIDVPETPINSVIPQNYLRRTLAQLPEVSEPQVVRHYTNLSNLNHHVDKDFYPLGSCTMKYNPKINDFIASSAVFSNAHPYQTEESVQGILHLLYELEQMLCKITGMDKTTLQPNAGSQGELLGILLMTKYHLSKGEKRKYILVPETAHGTNFSSVIIGGYDIKTLATNSRGRVSISDLKSKLDLDVAGLMLTQPNTLGLFEDQIEEISSLVHGVDGLMYMDGANLNAIVGLCKPSDMGFDIVHMNLHKTFSTPHGGGGPGSGPIGVVNKLVKYLPTPIVEKEEENYFFDYSNSQNSIGRVHSFYGNVGVLVRAYCYIKTLGSRGLKEVSKNAIINANYIKEKLKESYIIPFEKGTMHEFVISAKNQKERGLKALDIAKIILDYGFHAPTIYFPINIPESIMIEPTETETKETLDEFANAMIKIDNDIGTQSEFYSEAPYKTPVRRLDETLANRSLDVKYENDV